MTPEDWQRLKALLDAALQRDAGGREAYLREACGDDAEMLERAESLIASSEESWDGLEGGASRLTDLEGGPRTGERIGAYEILDEIGHGGMGTIYLGKRADEEFRQRVAIKLVRRGMDTDFVLRRFRHERQILAGLDHPHIARLLDGGATSDGRPYFVMEYVEGKPLLDDCDSRRLSIAERLKLFLDVCSAVQFAHQNLVVHRDIKPSNVLVTAEGAVKLLDFGIAKVLNPGPSSHTVDQTVSVLRLMTPDYASPEQVRGDPITTATDVYSLGIVLYELLTGHRPYRVTSAEPGEVARVVCEQVPGKPSTAVTRAEELPAAEGSESITLTPESVSRTREGEPKKLRRRLKGDLDNIVLMALRKEPQRRYASVGDFAEDIHRHLDGRPVRARRDTVGYRTSKFVRRNRAGVAAAALAIAALAGGLVWNLHEARRARAAEARAERRFNDVRRLANSFLFEFHDGIKDLPGSTPVRQLLVKRALEYLDSLSTERGGDVSLTRELAAAYQKVGDVQGNPFQPNLGDLAGAKGSYRKAIELLEPLASASGAKDEDRAALAQAYLTGSGIELATGDARGAVGMSEKGLALRKTLAKASADPKRGQDLASAWQFYSYNLSAAGRSAESFDALREQAALLRPLLAASPKDRMLRRGFGQNRYLTALAFDKRGDYAAARAAFLEAVGTQRELLAADPGNTAFRRDLSFSLTDLANLSGHSGEPVLALQSQREALAISETVAAADPKSVDARIAVAIAHNNIGRMLVKLEPAEGLRQLTEAVSLFESVATIAPSNAWAAGMLASSYASCADIYAARKDQASLESAYRLYRKSVDSFERLKAAGSLMRYKEPEAEVARKALADCEARLAKLRGAKEES